MSFDTRKIKAGQQVVKKVTIYTNACKFALSPYLDNIVTSAELKTSTYTGVLYSTFDSDLIDSWSTQTELYAKSKNTSELIKISISTLGQITIVSRGQFGTTSAQITQGDELEIWHKGRADGSCFGYSQTCSNSDSYDSTALKALVFSTHHLASGSNYFAGLNFKSVRYQSTEIKPYESIGSRARLSGEIVDGKQNGYSVVQWPERRSESGTFFGKLMAMHPYFQGRKIIYSEGLRDSGSFAEPEWIERSFIIDSVNFSDDIFTFEALDPLILTEGKKAKMPIVSTAQLTSAINSGSASISFSNALTDYFGTSGTLIVKIDSELIQVTANGTATMPILQRGYGNSEIKDHSINATVQNCILIENEHVIDLIVYALQTWTTVPTEYIDDYSAIVSEIPTKIISSWLISTPIDVVDFINYMIKLGELIFYFDESTNKIVIKYTNQLSISPIYLDEYNQIDPKSIKKDFNTKEQYTRLTAAWAPYDLSSTDDNNFQLVFTGINADMESHAKIGEVNEKKSEKYPMLTTSSADYLIAASAIDRVVSSAKEKPEFLECRLDAESIGDTQGASLTLGEIVSISTKENQNASGDTIPILYQLLKLSGDAWSGYAAKFKRYQLYDPSAFDFSITAGTYINYILTDHYSPTIAGEYIIYVETGAIFGSYDTTIASFSTGTPSAGVTFKFIARWQIMGMGGAGASFYWTGGTATTAEDGGIAFEALCDCVIDNGSGLIWAGGGGGGSDLSAVVPNPSSPYWYSAEGGCGGQGFVNSSGGYYTIGAIVPATPSNNGTCEAGNQSKFGALNGRNGGAWGEAGENGTYTNGGAAGIAIKSNGFNVSIISGDNSLSIRGSRI